MKTPRPHPLTPYKGRRMFRWFVSVRQEWLDAELERREVIVPVIAPTAVDAICLVQGELVPHLSRPTAFEVAGPRGGRTERFIGWETMIGRQLWVERPAWIQLPLC